MPRSSVVELSRDEARAVAVSSSGFADRTESGATAVSPTRANVLGVVRHLGQLQIDSVSVFERAHYLPVFSRLGAYDRNHLDALGASNGGLVEYWPHQAGFIPVSDWGLWEFRRAEWRTDRREYLEAQRELIAWVRSELKHNGPMSAKELERDTRDGKGQWWDWSETKRLLEILWRTGDVICQTRRGFERLYELPETVTGLDHGAEVPFETAADALLDRAAASLGVFTEADLADYWRMRRSEIRPAIARAVEAGTIRPARVEGWQSDSGRPLDAWIHRKARARRHTGSALVSPFDPLVWFRARNLRLFDFHYRIEIYTPAPQRQFGYYTLPLLVGDQIVGRIDLKRDRGSSALLVQSAWVEERCTDPVPQDVIASAISELSRAASWQGLTTVTVRPRGNLSAALPGTWTVG